ncbi:Potassium/sodium hyperpolarization-activated cyclic nucleotide-gated channel 4, partial [Schistosoma japonicum]
KLSFRYHSVGLLNSLHLLPTNSNTNSINNKPCTSMKSLETYTRRYTINFPNDKNEMKYQPINETSSYIDVGGDNSILNEIEEPLSMENSSIYHHQRQNILNNNNSNNQNNQNSQNSFRERGWSIYNLKEQFISFFQPSDNKLALKLFGNKVALACEKRRQREQGKWIIHPCSNFRFYWNVIMLVLLMANLIMLPVIISFFNDDLPGNWLIFNSISDTLFILDIIVNFRTGIIRNDFVDDIILDPTEIAREYLKTWFILDLISSIPMDYVLFAFKGYEQGERAEHLVQAGRALRILRLAKLLSLLRLLRLSRLVRYITQWEEFINIASKFMGICNLVLIMLILGHWNACLQFLVPMLMDFPVDSWVSKARLQNAHWFEQYTWALFKALSHMLSIGYGRFPPSTLPEAWITIISMMTGATCYALFVGHAAALIQSFDASKRKYREMLKQVEEYMAYKKYPRALRRRIAGYYEHRYKGKMFNEKEILGELSECLREQIINYNCRALVASVPIFANADQNFVSEVIVKLKQEVFQPGDLIIKEGTYGTKMYFIQEGIVNIITKDGILATRLSDGCYFGEICLLTNARRVASVEAETYCTLYSLDQKHFYDVLENYPEMRLTLEKVAAERLQSLGHRTSIIQSSNNKTEQSDYASKIADEIIKHQHNSTFCIKDDCSQPLNSTNSNNQLKKSISFIKNKSFSSMDNSNVYMKTNLHVQMSKPILTQSTELINIHQEKQYFNNENNQLKIHQQLMPTTNIHSLDE